MADVAVACFGRHPEWTTVSPTLYWGTFVKTKINCPNPIPPCEFMLKDAKGVYKLHRLLLPIPKIPSVRPEFVAMSPMSAREDTNKTDDTGGVVADIVQPQPLFTIPSLPQAGQPEQTASYDLAASDPPRPPTMTQVDYHAFLKAVRSFALLGAPSFQLFEQSVKAKLYDHMPKELNHTTARQVKQFLGDHIADGRSWLATTCESDP